jgi:hypothetical protein
MLLSILMIKPLRDVDVESCQRRCCRVMLVMTLCSCRSHTGDGAAESCWWWRCRVFLVMVVATMLSSPTGDDAADATLVTVRCRCWVILATVVLSHTGDGAVETTWPWRDVDVESCWWQYCRVLLVTVLPSPARDGAAEATLVMTRYRCWGDLAVAWCLCRGDLAMAQCRCRVMLAKSLPRLLDRGAMYLSSHAAQLESGSTTGAVICARSRNVPAL